MVFHLPTCIYNSVHEVYARNPMNIYWKLLQESDQLDGQEWCGGEECRWQRMWRNK